MWHMLRLVPRNPRSGPIARQFRRKMLCLSLVVVLDEAFLPELEVSQLIDIWCLTCQSIIWCSPSQHGPCSPVHDVWNVLANQEPCLRRSPCHVEYPIDITFHILITPFRIVLVLLMWFGLSILDKVSPKDVLNGITNFGLCSVTDDLIHSSPEQIGRASCRERV